MRKTADTVSTDQLAIISKV